MRASRLTAVAVAAGALVAATAPLALAGVEVNPNPVAPGGMVTVNDGGGGSRLCPLSDKTATANSNGFVGNAIKLSMGTMTLVGSGTAVSTSGKFMVSITCASGVSSGPGTFFLTVGTGGAKTGDGASQGSDSAELTLGAVVLAGATVVGGMAMRRRRAGAQA